MKVRELWIRYKEIILYLVFGVSTTLVNWIVYAICTKVAGLSAEGLEITISNCIAWVFAVLFAFITNKCFVFESKCATKGLVLQEMSKFFGARILSGIFEMGLPVFFMAIGLKQAFLGMPGGVAKMITSVVVIVMNYVLSKLVVFRKKQSDMEK